MAVLLHVDPCSPDARRLIKLSDELMLSLYPPEACFLDSPEDLEDARAFVLGVEVDGALVAIGAAKVVSVYGELGYGELKRVYTIPDFRGRGFGRWIISSLEDCLRSIVSVACLETGTKQPESIALYTGLGWKPRGPFGEYTDNGYSVFMEKHL